jgi:hypothetical protein
MAMKKGKEPGGSEFSHGRGLHPQDEALVPREGYQELHALYRMDSTDPAAQPNYKGERDRTDKETTIPTREKGDPFR